MTIYVTKGFYYNLDDDKVALLIFYVDGVYFITF